MPDPDAPDWKPQYGILYIPDSVEFDPADLDDLWTRAPLVLPKSMEMSVHFRIADPIEYWRTLAVMAGFGPPIAYAELDGLGDN